MTRGNPWWSLLYATGSKGCGDCLLPLLTFTGTPWSRILQLTCSQVHLKSLEFNVEQYRLCMLIKFESSMLRYKAWDYGGLL